ncbi:MAG: RNA polymerase sigma factor, partial [Firmicutes bacterium]|nr:RNA polymerase sigma factor [Bacillota bacterium]
MDRQELGRQIIALTGTLYHISYSLLRSEADREDAVQSAIEKGWRKAATLRDERKLKPWLVRILMNECYAILRKNRREFPAETLYDEPERADSAGTALRDEILSLPETLRLPIVLHYMEGFSILEIASALRCPKGTVLSRMNRGRNMIKRHLT